MAKYRTSIASATAAIDWTDLRASGQPLNGGPRAVVIRSNKATRVAVGVADPVASNTIGVAVAAGVGITVMLGTGAAVQSVWVQTPADQSRVIVEIDTVSQEVVGVFA